MNRINFFGLLFVFLFLSVSVSGQTIELQDDQGKSYLCDLSSGEAIAVNEKNISVRKLLKKTRNKLKKESDPKKIKKLKKKIKKYKKHIKICEEANSGSSGSGNSGGSSGTGSSNPLLYYCEASGLINVCYNDGYGGYTTCYPQTINGISDQLYDNVVSAQIASEIDCGNRMTTAIISANIGDSQGSTLQSCQVVQCYYCQQPNC